MSADVDQEIYDDCASLAKPKPPVMAKPAGVRNLAAMFQNPADTTTSKTPEVKPKPTPAGKSPMAKPVAVVSPSTQSNSDTRKAGTTKTGGWKPPVKPPVSPNKVNGAIKTNNNNDSKITNSVQSNGMNRQTSISKGIPGTDRVSKLNIPNAFSKPTDTSPKSSSQSAQNNATSEKPPELSHLKSTLRPVGGINSKMTNINNSYTASKKSLNTSSQKSPASPPNQDPDIVLSCDKKKFKLKDKTKAIRFPGKLPVKPPKLEHVDFSSIISSIPPSLPTRLPPRSDKSLPVEEEGDEIYDDVDNTPTFRPVSEIKEYTEEEEERETSGGSYLEQETYDDADTAPQLPTRSYPPKHSPSFTGSGETYDDCATSITEGVAEVEGEVEELYEALDELQPSATSSPTDTKKEEEKRREQERKEKKEKDRKEREEKEKQKKLEKEKKKEKDLLAKFKITGEEVSIADGTVKENAKGGKSDLGIKKGESVSILRMTDNPQYKWLAKTQDGKIGYVDIKNIEVDTKGIRDIMEGTLKNAKNEALKQSASGEPEETYDDVDTLDEPDQDIYEESM